MSEDQDFIDRKQALCRGYIGKELSPTEMATEFAKWGPQDRVDSLMQLESESSDLSLIEATKIRAYGSALRRTHERLRKIER